DRARTQSAVEQARVIERNSGAVAAQPAAPVEDQNDRLLRGIEAAQADRTQAAVEQVRVGERNLGPVPVVTVAAQPLPAADSTGVNLLATLLLGLIGGLAGGAAIAAIAAAGRRHAQRAVAA
ncbi:MAG TPA: hypothetical protein VLA80_03500, partial [Actinomycetota bacterium]|nr:hypothetical protein [Actinomycetota bacterium]